MSLQYYDVTVAANTSQEIGAQGRYLRYLSGTTPNVTNGTVSQSAQNQALLVTSGSTGNSLVLMPGQSIRIPENEKSPATWRVRNFKNLETITGILLAGDGDFRDDNLINIIGNGTSQSVPVNPQTGIYTNSYFNATAGPVSNGNVIFSAASNVAGAWVESIIVAMAQTTNNAQSEVTFTAKSTPSAGMYDGDVIMQTQIIGATGLNIQCNDKLQNRIFIPAGKGLYWNITFAGNAPFYCNKSVLYKLL